MNKKQMSGFTLVELLAVIVILAIILVIAVPKVMTIITEAKKATLESTAKVIAGQAEKTKLQNQILGNYKEINCEDIAKINDVDYETCSIEFDGNTAKVTLVGSGKFEGLYVCGGTKVNSTATTESCGLVSLTVDLAGGTDTVDYEASYEPGTEVTLTNPTREGYSFMGWSVTGLSASIQDNKLKVGTTSTTITAIWEEYSEDYPVLLNGPTFNQILYDYGYEDISAVSFVDSYTPTEDDPQPIDISVAEDRSILLYIITTPEYYEEAVIVGNGSGGILLNEDSSYMFSYLLDLKVINGMELLRWVNVENNDYMFEATSIESINLGAAKIIGDYTFNACIELKSITIPNSVTSIGNSAFSGCESLTSLTIPNSVTSIDNGAFEGCIGLTSITIPNSVTSIGDFAFSNCNNLTNVTIGNSVTSIGHFAFYICTSLTNINVDEDNANYASINGVLYSKDKKILIMYPLGKENTTFTIPNSVISIAEYAFYEHTRITSVIIGNSVTNIGDSAFSGCDSLTSITIPNSVISIEGYAFYDCNNLTNVTIGNSVISIEGYAFYNCNNLTNVTIGNSVTSIGEYAFWNCNSLKEVYYTGKQEDWNKITIGSNNTPLTNATKHYEHVIE